MNKLYMGLDIGSVLAKGVIIDEYNNIITSSYLYVEGNPVMAVKKIIKDMRRGINLENDMVVSVGITGRARKLIGAMLSASVIKNEITANYIGTIKMYPDVKTIFDIGGEDAKIICINNGIVSDYGINTLCSAGTGFFIDSLVRELNISIQDANKMALGSKNNINISSRCCIFALNDLIHKMSEGYKKEDILKAAFKMVAVNYVNNVCKGKKIQSPIVFNGGVSKNMVVVKTLENILHEKIIVNNNSHLMAAFGIAVMARESGYESVFDFNVDKYNIETKLLNCSKCSNNCLVVEVYKNNKLIDKWGNKCNREELIKNM